MESPAHSWRKTVARWAVLLVIASPLSGQVAVTTHHNDNNRSGQNLNETILNTSNVSVSNFGKLFVRTVDGQIYAQPLYVPGLTIGGSKRNVVFVATQNDSVYAFDADDPAASLPLWHINLGTPVPSTDVDPGCADITPQVGITSTPVIDSTTGTIYVVAKTKKASDSSYHFNLHALDLLTGAEKFGGPVEINGQVAGSGLSSVNGYVPFQQLYQNNRPGLLLMNGVVYVAFGSMCETPPWHGWLFAYSASTLQQLNIFNTTPDGEFGGVWGGGQGLVGDVDSIYFMTGNGTFDANTSGSDYGNSVIKVSTSSGMAISDYFTPYNQASLNTADTDLGSGGPMLLPGTSTLVGMGKDGILRVINTKSMGKYNSTFNADVQEFRATTGVFMGAPVYWNSPNNGPEIYLWGGGDYLKAYRFGGTTFQTTPISKSSMTSASGYSNSSPLSISSSGSQVGSGILWSASPLSGNANQQTVPGILRAFDASNLAHELWDSQQNPSRDSVGNYAKFSPPTIANGKVYLGTFSNQLLVYGLIPPPSPNGGIQFIQVNYATPHPAASSIALGYPMAQYAGDLNIVVVGWNDATSTIQSVKDSSGNAYKLAGTLLRIGSGNGGSALSEAIYYAAKVAAGSNTVTVTFNQAATHPDVRILEYAGVDTLDVTAGATGKSATSNSGSATTTAANDLIFSANTVYTLTTAAGSGFVARVITWPNGDIAEDKVVSTIGSYSATAPLSAAGTWIMQMAAFKATAASTAPSISSLSPASGPTTGGTAVTITGNNFVSGASVTFGGIAATGIQVVNSTSITAITPSHSAGAVNVVVTNPDLQTATLSNGYTYVSSTGIGFVQLNYAVPQSFASAIVISYPAAQMTGDLNIVVVGWNDTTSSVQSVTDSRGNTYAPAGTLLRMGSGTAAPLSQQIFYASGIAGGSNTVTVTFTQAANHPDVRVLEYSGLATLDAAAGATGHSTIASSTAVTTSAANELIFSANMVYTLTSGPGSGFTARVITSPDGDIAEDRIVSVTGSYSATAPLTQSGNWVMQVATFK